MERVKKNDENEPKECKKSHIIQWALANQPRQLSGTFLLLIFFPFYKKLDIKGHQHSSKLESLVWGLGQTRMKELFQI